MEKDPPAGVLPYAVLSAAMRPSGLLKTSASPLIRGSRPSPMNCIPESRFPIIILSVISSTFITITGSLSWRSITAAEAGSAGRWETVSACISEKGISPST